MSITLKEIADMAGVHKSTVDKVIHNRPGVSDTKRQQIRQLLNEHGYASNPLAKALTYRCGCSSAGGCHARTPGRRRTCTAGFHQL